MKMHLKGIAANAHVHTVYMCFRLNDTVFELIPGKIICHLWHGICTY
jgi:hypothetical protein